MHALRVFSASNVTDVVFHLCTARVKRGTGRKARYRTTVWESKTLPVRIDKKYFHRHAGSQYACKQLLPYKVKRVPLRIDWSAALSVKVQGTTII